MKMYPTLEQVEKADREQLARWHRFLPSPGADAIREGREAFDVALDIESPIMGRICERLDAIGGMTPEISKRIGL